MTYAMARSCAEPADAADAAETLAETKKNKATKKGGTKAKSSGAASGLKRPPSAYLLYCNNKRAKVVADFQAKEAQTGLSRHTWDAKVRIFQARKRAKEAGNGVDIQYVIPREGAQM